MNTQHQKQQLHVVFLPFLAPGHIMPMIEMARTLASEGSIKGTIITTAANASNFGKNISTDTKLGNKLAFLIITLPLKEVGLPEGCENLISTPTRESSFKLLEAIGLLRPELEKMLVQSKPDCIVSDVLYPWTVEVGQKLGIPRIEFSGSSFFKSCVCHSLGSYRPHDKVNTESEAFIVPNLPDKITMTRSELQDIAKGKTSYSALFERLEEAQRKSFGVLMNSFYELESSYADYFRKTMLIKSWHIGPLLLFRRTLNNNGPKADVSTPNLQSCFKWLKSKRPRSVLYICFGSLTQFTKPQLSEMAGALEALACPFIWVLGKVIKSNEDLTKKQGEDYWLPDKFEEKMKESGKGLVLKGWAPQEMILEHKAIGGFMTHCGWNSILEGVCAGVPMITWPIFAEQFYNEKLVTQVHKIGVEVGNPTWRQWATDESELVQKEKIKAAVTRVMYAGTEREEIYGRVNMFKNLAHKAVSVGGSSNNDIKELVAEIRQYQSHRLQSEH